MGLSGTAIERADLNVVLVVLAELHDAGVSAVMDERGDEGGCERPHLFQKCPCLYISEGVYIR